jgi:hypothetical protein
MKFIAVISSITCYAGAGYSLWDVSMEEMFGVGLLVAGMVASYISNDL